MTFTSNAHLTRLELQGFKSFASRTTFVFEPGITAIIGPNGSGKSNIADAVRWVLGEQSHALLRSKKTEDFIFAGGNGRAPAGMAEVTVTFDNSNGWLPIEFNEVTVTRRAFRSGENQFLINGRKVRLKDVHHLTASLGHSYTVVGQGLVDAALSQRAEERRGLFEHAADLTGLQLKASEAERNLAEAETNSARILDLLAEVEPRLRTLERAAKQAREWQGVHDRLKALERAYFRELLASALGLFQEAEAANEAEEANLARVRDRVDEFVEALAGAKQSAEAARAALSRRTAHLAAVTDQARKAAHERDIVGERIAAVARRRDDLLETQKGLDDQASVIERQLAEVSAEVESIETAALNLKSNLSISAGEVTRARDAHSARQRQYERLASAVVELERRFDEIERQQALLEQQVASGSAEGERFRAAASDLANRVSLLEADLALLDGRREETNAVLESLESRASQLQIDREQLARNEETARGQVVEIEQSLNRARAHYEALLRIQESGAGFHAGVREVLSAGRKGALQGIQGTIAELIVVPAAYETAIEVALGSHLQDIIVRRWSDAEAAIEHLKAKGSGRATFQPLDSVRLYTQHSAGAALKIGGVHGLAVDLTETSETYRTVLTALLGRTLVVDDLQVARKCLLDLSPGWNVVTLAGEIARAGGSVTGGSALRESGVLTREREARELPEAISSTQLELTFAQEVLVIAVDACRQNSESLQQVAAEKAALRASLSELSGRRAQVANWLENSRQQSALNAERMSDMDSRARDDAGKQETLATEGRRVSTELHQARSAKAEALADLERDTARIRSIEELTAIDQKNAAILDERLRSERKRQSGLRAQKEALASERMARTERIAALDGELSIIEEEYRRLVAEASALENERASLENDQKPHERETDEAGKRLQEVEQRLEVARQDLLRAERERNTTSLAVERARGELGAVRQRVVDEFEFDDPDDLLTSPVDMELDAIESEREIARLKERLRRVGFIGEEAVEEFERESERYRFLREQLEDVRGASASLRQLLEELRSTMRRRFDETFVRVAEAFSEAFTTLFGGGTAELIMVSDENGGQGGVDIVAQPPGKRLQSLALLSGGERVLAAAALLFAILKVNPTPFVLLDEVDAALDEANIVRFREQLQSLARESQAIIITHNRGTIEVAESLYGVTMREDGTSTVLSMRMAEAMAG